MTAFTINSAEDFARLRLLGSKMPMILKVAQIEEAASTYQIPGSTIRSC